MEQNTGEWDTRVIRPHLKEMIDSGLDAKNFLNDILEILYLFNRRINLGPIENDLMNLVDVNEGQVIKVGDVKFQVRGGAFFKID